MELGSSRTAIARPAASMSRSLASLQNAHTPSRSNARRSSYATNSELGESYAPSSPFGDDYVELETASARAETIDRDVRHGVDNRERGHLIRLPSISPATHLITPEGRLGTIATSVGREKNELADVPFKAMRAMGGRYSQLAV